MWGEFGPHKPVSEEASDGSTSPPVSKRIRVKSGVQRRRRGAVIGERSARLRLFRRRPVGVQQAHRRIATALYYSVAEVGRAEAPLRSRLRAARGAPQEGRNRLG